MYSLINFRTSKMLLFILPLVGFCFCESTVSPADIIKTLSSSKDPHTTFFTKLTTTSAKPLTSTAASPTAPLTTKGYSDITTKAYVSTESAIEISSKKYPSTKSPEKSARRQKLNTTSSVLTKAAHSLASLEERLGAVDCDLPVLPRESRLWRGNETHELHLPVTECMGPSAAADEECPPAVISWEGSADIQSGDILIVRIQESGLHNDTEIEPKNITVEHNPIGNTDRVHQAVPQPAVYQVTRQGHEHCDLTDGMLLDITPLDEGGAKLITLYNKDLAEGVNLLIVVSKNWGSQCVRLKVTVKSDNCGESQDCSGNGVCYTNVSMEGYECQCCPGFVGPHCEDTDPCNPSPCLNNGICVEISQPVSGANYHCLCPYGFTGRKCEKDPCYSAPCLNGGSCMSMALNGSTTFHCACADGWSGARCDVPSTGGACSSNPCVNGICVEQTDSGIQGDFRCFCRPGYTGDNCELEYNECESSPCSNGGTCTDQVGGFTCVCGRGYTGNTCQLKVDLCNPNPCPEHRFCIDRGNNYACECPRGFVGEECTIPTRSACDNNPCAHGGTCWNGVDSFYCSCRPGYTGRLCEDDFILESVMGSEESEMPRSGGSVREVHLPLGLYHDRLHNVYIAAGTLGAAIAIVGVVVTACHCGVQRSWRCGRATRAVARHWLQQPPPPHPAAPLDTADMYYTLDFSDSQSSPLIQ